MTTKFRHEGDRVYFTPVADVSVGDIVSLAGFAGLALHNIKAGEQGALAIDGVYSIDKKAGDAFSVFQQVFFDTATKRATVAQTSIAIGIAAVAAASGDATVDVIFNCSRPIASAIVVGTSAPNNSDGMPDGTVYIQG